MLRILFSQHTLVLVSTALLLLFAYERTCIVAFTTTTPSSKGRSRFVVAPRFGLFTPDPTSSSRGGRAGRRLVNGDQHASFTYQQEQKENVTRTNNDTTTATTTATVVPDSTAAAEVGLGGLGGCVYDVNRLKRNLLQETVQAYKAELWRMLASPASTEQQVLQKLAALVQASPLSCTTDSNLLDGTWTLAYTSKYGTVPDLLRPQTFTLKKNNNGSNNNNNNCPQSSRRRSGKEALVWTRQWTVCLEDLETDTSAYTVQDLRLLGGAITRSTKSAVTGLTRQTLSLATDSREWRVFGQCIHRKSEEPRTAVSVPAKSPPTTTKELHVVYIDGNLAIFAENSNNNNANAKTFSVYTQNNPTWTDATERARRKLRYLVAAFEYFVLRRRQKYDLAGEYSNNNNSNNSNTRRRRRIHSSSSSRGDNPDRISILEEIQVADSSSKLRVLRLGDLSVDNDNIDFDDDTEAAWEGSADPFVHLSADERQETLKGMSVRQVEKAQRATKGGWFWKLLFQRNKRRKTFFKKPEDIH